MDPFVQMIVTIVVAVLGSSGLWAFIQRRSDKNSAQTKLLIGLAHDRIEYLAANYIHRGWITAEEYDNLYRYLYLPYKENGGNGTGEKIMEKVDKLPIKDRHEYTKEDIW